MSRRAIALTVLLLAACGEAPPGSTVAVPGRPDVVKSTAAVRAERRLFDGAPPVVPHQDFGAACLSCHATGMAIKDLGYAPPVPHTDVMPPAAMSRCEQCHVFRRTETEFVTSTFAGLRQDLRAGSRLNALAPPVIPHQLQLREKCLACHDGPGAREEVRCRHPERVRCLQCHLEQRTVAEFTR